MSPERKAYPSDVTDEEWVLVAPYLTLLPEDAGQREHPLREMFNGLRYLVRHGVARHAERPAALAGDLRPSATLVAAGCFEMLVHDVRGAAPGPGPLWGDIGGGGRII